MWKKTLQIAALTCAMLFGVGVAAGPFEAPQAESAGVIESLDFGRNSMVVGGYSYEVATTADVQIAGSYGAFTMLESGMQIEFVYERHSDGVRRIVEVREVAGIEES